MNKPTRYTLWRQNSKWYCRRGRDDRVVFADTADAAIEAADRFEALAETYTRHMIRQCDAATCQHCKEGVLPWDESDLREIERNT